MNTRYNQRIDPHPPTYVHEIEEWLTSSYRWDHSALADDLAAIHFRRGRLITIMASLGFDTRSEAMLSVLVQDVTKSSEIEGDLLNAGQVRSSIARRLGLDYSGLPEPDRHVDGVVEMMLDATQRFDAPLDEERIFGWHSALFPTGRSGMHKIVVGRWRDDGLGPMQVVSGPMGRETVHYEAPSADRVAAEMARFLEWFEHESLDPIIKAAIGHLWFVTIHPLDDGNGRIGRAIMDMALARADGTKERFYSVSAQIHREKSSYYQALERSQKRLTMDVTPWIRWFLDRVSDALASAEQVLEVVHSKREFWDRHSDAGLNERQTQILNRLLDGFEGKLQTAKYAKITKTSADTALRDLTDLVAKGILVKDEAGGRSTSYRLARNGFPS